MQSTINGMTDNLQNTEGAFEYKKLSLMMVKPR